MARTPRFGAAFYAWLRDRWTAGRRAALRHRPDTARRGGMGRVVQLAVLASGDCRDVASDARCRAVPGFPVRRGRVPAGTAARARADAPRSADRGQRAISRRCNQLLLRQRLRRGHEPGDDAQCYRDRSGGSGRPHEFRSLRPRDAARRASCRARLARVTPLLDLARAVATAAGLHRFGARAVCGRPVRLLGGLRSLLSRAQTGSLRAESGRAGRELRWTAVREGTSRSARTAARPRRQCAAHRGGRRQTASAVPGGWRDGASREFPARRLCARDEPGAAGTAGRRVLRPCDIVRDVDGDLGAVHVLPSAARALQRRSGRPLHESARLADESGFRRRVARQQCRLQRRLRAGRAGRLLQASPIPCTVRTRTATTKSC